MTNPEIETARQIITQTQQSVFLTGRAGTGKTTFLRNLRAEKCKRMVVLAPTGIAAINAGGSTLHSFFQLPFSPYVPGMNFKKENFRMHRTKLRMIRSLDLVVIDEISMVRADLLDNVDATLRRIRRSELPFGGVQLLMIGDLSQLAPVATEDEWQLLSRHYATPYFFSSQALKRLSYATIELTHVYRQTDDRFIHLLNHIREGNADDTVLQAINRRYIPDFRPKEGERYIRLVTHNRMADAINRNELDRLPTRAYTFTAKIKGNFPAFSFPTEDELTLKQGAQVMFVKNDPEHRYVNGTLGVISSISDQGISVRIEEGTPGDAEGDRRSYRDIEVTREKWENMRYTLNEKTAEIEEVMDGQFQQYPIKLAWAITIHKSQGLTFDHAILDVAHSFAHGQAYVALSRLRTFEGLILSAPVTREAIIIDPAVQSFLQSSREMPDDAQMQSWVRDGLYAVVSELCDFSALRRELSQLNLLIDKYLPATRFPRLAGLSREAMAHFVENIENVTHKFAVQYTSLIQSDNALTPDSLLQERLRKAAHYFHDELTVVRRNVDGLLDVCLKATNKEVRRLATDHRQQFAELFRQRLDLLAYVHENGLDVTEYPTVRTRILCGLTPTQEKGRTKSGPAEQSRQKTAPQNPSDTADTALLYETLRQWRLQRAREEGKMAFQVVTNQALEGIVRLQPVDRDRLIRVSGIGPAKSEAYGDDIIRLVRDFRERQKP